LGYKRLIGIIMAAISMVEIATVDLKAESYEGGLKNIAAILVSQLEAANQRTGAVLDFTDLQGSPNELGRFLAQELSDQLVSAARRISFVDRANLQAIAREHNLTVEGAVSPESSKKLGNFLGADTLLLGTVTPLGDNIRLSVRAIAAETSKIIVSQSVTLPATGGLADLYTHGIANAPSDTAPSKGGLRDRLRPDSIRLTGNFLELDDRMHSSESYLNFSIENKSGVGLWIALRWGKNSVGPCNDNGRSDISGLNKLADADLQKLQQNPALGKSLQWLPSNGRVSGTMDFGCNFSTFSGQQTVPITLSTILITDQEVVLLPLTFDKTPIQRK